MPNFFYLCAMKVAFTGHREFLATETSRLEGVIRQLYSEGYTTFLCGMAAGFDLAAAQCVVALKSECTEIELECIIPFKGHIDTLSREDRVRYRSICAAADRVVTLSDIRHEKVYFDRNDYLIDNADAVICYYSGRKRSGTGYTVTRALKKRLRVVNIYADGVQIQFFG